MSTRSGAGPARLALVTALVAAAALALGLARAKPAGAHSGLEDVVGAVDAAVAAQLPADPRLWGAYTHRATPVDSCRSGSPRCVDVTIADMTRRLDRLAPRCDHDAVFSLLYLRVTERYKQVAATPGYFVSTRTVNWEDKVFADLYVGSYDDWHANRPLRVPPAWRLAYAAADASQVSGTGDAVLGMIAHILRDLPFTLYSIARVDYRDHQAINPMLESVYDEVIKELADRFDPTMWPATVVPGTEVPVMQAIFQWREKAWRDGQALLATRSAEEWRAEAARIEREAWATGLSVYLASRYPVQQATVVRDAYCATHWNS